MCLPFLQTWPVLVLLIGQRVDHDLIIEVVQGCGQLASALEGGDSRGGLALD